MKKHLLLSLTLSLMATSAFAQMTDDDCDPSQASDCDSHTSRIKDVTRDIYPWKPLTTGKIRERIETLTENKNFLWDIREMDRRGLTRANTRTQPWGGSFWPVYQGGIANTYQDKDLTFYIFTPLRNTMWQQNVKDFKKREQKVLPRIYELDEKDLAKLAPSEKYDILLGDTNFGLTKTMWNYVEKYGEDKKWSFLTKIDMPDGYRLPNPGSMIALWEGICHGWALGAGYIPRPEKTVDFILPNGKKMPFYPNDIKALASLTWANSNLQDNILFEGNRCNKKNPDKDKFGRFIDTEIDGNDSELIPRCADVHPAIYHVSVVNVMGVEGRPIVYDHNAKLAIANQPASGYEYSYYNLATGKDGSLNQSMVALRDYVKDPYYESRNPEAVYVVGVEMNAKYVDWQQPRKRETDSPADDKIVDNKFLYDLEINAAGKIVGGQWHVSKKPGSFGGETNQPDYFWLAPKDYKKFFEPVKGLPTWRGATLPPQEYAQASKAAVGFVYEESPAFFGGVSPKCKVMPVNPKDAPVTVDCEFKIPKPQPLINVVDRLIELSRR
jgi:Transglutaminase elicitor